MSMNRYNKVIQCDLCKCTLDVDTALPNTARERARKRHWAVAIAKVVNGSIQLMDFCPACPSKTGTELLMGAPLTREEAFNTLEQLLQEADIDAVLREHAYNALYTLRQMRFIP